MSTREYSGVTAARVQGILDEAKQHGASIYGNETSGEVVGDGAHVVYAFDSEAEKLTLTLKQKPFFLSDNFVFAAIEDNTGLDAKGEASEQPVQVTGPVAEEQPVEEEK